MKSQGQRTKQNRNKRMTVAGGLLFKRLTRVAKVGLGRNNPLFLSFLVQPYLLLVLRLDHERHWYCEEGWVGRSCLCSPWVSCRGASSCRDRDRGRKQ